MHRFFVLPHRLTTASVILTGDQAHQMRRVLRLRPGDEVILLDGQGSACRATVQSIGDQGVQLEIVERSAAGGEPPVHVTLYQAVLKGDHFNWVLQKGTEVGVSVFVPTMCERNVVDRLDEIDAKRGRWERIIQEAAEQCGRARLPQLCPAQPFEQALQTHDGATGLRILPWEGERVTTLREVLGSCNPEDRVRIELFVGPEGGFTAAEVDLARHGGVHLVTLGPRILRAETAGLVAVAAILTHAGEY